VNPEAADFWGRARQSLATARVLADLDPDASASRSYYAAFYAVTALFALEGRSFRKHTTLEAAVHRDLVKGGRWNTEIGAAFSWLVSLRATADYGGGLHVSAEDCRIALLKAESVLKAVRGCSPEPLPP